VPGIAHGHAQRGRHLLLEGAHRQRIAALLLKASDQEPLHLLARHLDHMIVGEQVTVLGHEEPAPLRLHHVSLTTSLRAGAEPGPRVLGEQLELGLAERGRGSPRASLGHGSLLEPTRRVGGEGGKRC